MSNKWIPLSIKLSETAEFDLILFNSKQYYRHNDKEVVGLKAELIFFEFMVLYQFYQCFEVGFAPDQPIIPLTYQEYKQMS